MLEAIRNSANSWAAKILLGLVALSFVYWGADSRSGRSGVSSLATVGGTTISQADYQRAYENEIEQLSQRARRRITSQEARLYGIDRRVISRLIGTSALDNQARTLGLGLSDDTVAQTLRSDPNLAGLDGRFDRERFNGLLRSMGVTERAFIDIKRREDERAQLTGTLLSSMVTPKPVIAALHAWKDETRAIEFVNIDPDKAVNVAEPDDAALKATYDTNKPAFMAPEYRHLEVLLLSVEDLKTRVAVSDAEISASYDETKENYATPELRRIQQIPFKDKAAAAAAKAAIDGGKNFMTIAQELGFKDADVEIGLVTQKALVDSEIAKAAFALPRDQVSGVIDGKLTTVLLRVPEIQPGKQPTLEDVRESVKEKLARAKAKEEVAKLRDTVEDQRNAGKSSAEIATALKLKLVDVPQTDSANKTADGKTALDLPDARALIASGFDTKSGSEREAVDLADGGVAWVGSSGIVAPRQKTYDEVAAELKTLTIANQRRKLIQELATKLVDRANAGEPFDALAATAFGKADKTALIIRSTTPQGLSDSAVAQAFAMAQGGASSAETTDKKSRIVFRVAEIKPADPVTKEQSAQLTQQVGQDLQVDMIDAYVAALQEQVGVTINEGELRRMAGGTSTQ